MNKIRANRLLTGLPLLLLSISLSISLSKPASASPELHWVSSGLNNRDITFSPDGNTLLTTIMSPKNLFAAIAISHRVGGNWTDLEIAPFSGEYQDIEPMFTPHGRQLFFASRRPKPMSEGNDWDIWRVDYNDGKWSEPTNLGEPINTRGPEFYPSISSNGNLYFTATRDEGMGSEDIYRAIYDEGRYTHVENIGDGVNTGTYEFNAFIAPDESYLIFGSQRREGEIGGGDLYISKNINGSFQSASMLNSDINSKRLDYCPYVFRGRFYFTSERATPIKGPVDYSTLRRSFSSPGNGLGDIYSIPFEDIN